MLEMGLEQVYAQIEEALAKQDTSKAENLCYPALDQFPKDPQLLFYASHCLVKREKYMLAKLACEESIRLSPNGRAYGNLGAIYRRMNDNETAEKMLNLAIEYEPNEKNAWNNKAANYVNEGNPDPGIEAARKALEIDPDFVKASWNLGLLLLEKGQFSEGWDRYRDGLALQDRMLRSYSKGEGGPKLVEDLLELQGFRRENNRKPRCIVWGEQGIGDEIMFSTILKDFSEYVEIVFECHPRLMEIFKRSYPFITEFHPTRKDDHITWPLEVEPCEFKCPIGDLGKFFRRTKAAFQYAAKNQSPWIKADKKLVQEYRSVLEKIGGDRRFVGVAWTGGVLRTMRWYRSVQLPELYNLANDPDVILVSLQYEDDTSAIDQFIKSTGKQMLRFPAITQHYNYEHTLALVMALDEVVTVCQSVAHLSAAAGQVTRVLVPDKPAWRYGLEGNDWYWYGENAKLYRREGTDWTKAITKVLVDMDLSPLPQHERDLLPELEGRMLELGAKQFGKYKLWFEEHGMEHVSVDLNGSGGSVKRDLQKPLNLGMFDVVTNFGTSEHVESQEPCWRNMHVSLRLGGTLVCTTPSPGAKGWEKHGKWYPSEDWYREFAELNGYSIDLLDTHPDAKGRDMVRAVLKKTGSKGFQMPDIPIYENDGGKVGEYL